MGLLLKKGEFLKLELGSWEKRMPNWITIDQDPRADICLDLSKGLPFADNSVDEIYSSHLLEHFFYPDMRKLLVECHRVLKSGGVFKTAVPNMRIYIDAYVKPEEFKVPEQSLYKPAFHYFSKIDFVNYMAYLDGIHRFMFDEENLPKIIAEVGFRDVAIRPFELGLDLESRRHESVYAGGVK
jgi:predicted SAM-dependent methyltransferase